MVVVGGQYKRWYSIHPEKLRIVCVGGGETTYFGTECFKSGILSFFESN